MNRFLAGHLLAALALVAASLLARAAPPPQSSASQAATPQVSADPVVTLPDQASLDKQLELIRKILPQAKRVGVIYNPRQPIAAEAVKKLLELFPKAGLTLVDIAAPRTLDVGPAARNLIGRVDLIYTIFDDNVTMEYETVAKTCDDAHIPLFAADPIALRRGAMASLGLAGRKKDLVPPPAPVSPGQPGARRVAELRSRPVAGAAFDTYLNLGAAERQGVTIPDAVLKSAVIVDKP